MRYDCHVHMALDGADFRKAFDRHRARPDDDLIRAVLDDYACRGVTYLRDGGDKFGAGLRAARLAGEFGIEYRTPVFPICREGRYGSFIGRSFSDMTGFRALVSEAIDEGADFIKIMISGLMDFDRFGVLTSTPLTAEEIREITDYVHSRGLAVMAHANGADTVMNAVTAGIDSVEHGAYLTDECVRVLAASDTVWVPTISTISNLIGRGRFPDTVLVPLEALHADNIALCVSLGGHIAPGSDAGAYMVPHGKGAEDECRLLMEKAGLTEEMMTDGAERIRARFRR